jgi:hypothetical protein
VFLAAVHKGVSLVVCSEDGVLHICGHNTIIYRHVR